MHLHTMLSHCVTEDQAMSLTKALVERYRSMSSQEHSTPMKDDYTR